MRSNLARVHEPSHEPLQDAHTIAVAADPNGLAYDRNDDTLYVADGGGHVLAIEQGRRRRIATLDAAGCAGDQLGGIAVAPDGTLYVARLGHGRAGAIFRIAGGEAIALPGLSPRMWRLGIAYDAAAHALYATEYDKAEAGPCNGAVVRIDLRPAPETVIETVIEGLCKPVGVAKLGSTLVVTDARRRAVVFADLAGGGCSELAFGDRPDSVAACGPDAVVVTTYRPETGTGSVHKLWLDGTIATLTSGPWEPRGITSDGDRAFIALRRAGRVLVLRI